MEVRHTHTEFLVHLPAIGFGGGVGADAGGDGRGDGGGAGWGATRGGLC